MSARFLLRRAIPQRPQRGPRRFLSSTRQCLTASNSSGPGAAEAMGANELKVGEMEGVKLKIEPLRRVGEDANTMRARLLYQSRKRGTLESDLLMSTFADANLPTMTIEQMRQYDLFLDENDWDIYYWATQDPPAEGEAVAEPPKVPAQPKAGEWAQTVGTFKPAYRPVPTRWKNSEVLSMLRRHVRDRSAGGVHESTDSASGKGMAFMPKIRNMDQ